MRLARFEDSAGSSAGWWLVREMPGTVIYKSEEAGWKIMTSDLLFSEELEKEVAVSIWGEDFEGSVKSLSGRLTDEQLHTQVFASRFEALSALERTFTLPPKQALGELL